MVLHIKNNGSTPANVTDIVLTTKLMPHGDPLPIPPDYPSDARGRANLAFLYRDDEVFIKRLLPISQEDEAAVTERTKDFFMYGYVDYIDQFGQRHRAGYARGYEPGAERDNLFGESQSGYNYDRKRQQGEGNDWDTPI